MDERMSQGSPAEQPIQASEADGGVPTGTPLADPRALTILTTEHWSLLSARSLVYNEAFARAGMFLTFLSATLVALGLLSTATGFSREFLLVAATLFALDLFIGVATMARVASATADDIRCIQGMNRLRHAYHEMVPGLEHYFISGKHDDVRGVFAAYGAAEDVMSRPGLLHGFTTVPGMLGVICAAVAAVLAGVTVLLVTVAPIAAVVAAVITFAVGIAASMVNDDAPDRGLRGDVAVGLSVTADPGGATRCTRRTVSDSDPGRPRFGTGATRQAGPDADDRDQPAEERKRRYGRARAVMTARATVAIPKQANQRMSTTSVAENRLGWSADAMSVATVNASIPGTIVQTSCHPSVRDAMRLPTPYASSGPEYARARNASTAHGQTDATAPGRRNSAAASVVTITPCARRKARAQPGRASLAVRAPAAWAGVRASRTNSTSAITG
jgi:hypothetical protein